MDDNVTDWSSLNLSDELLALVKTAGFIAPTPIQVQAIPPAMEGKDVIASAQTGSGKTAAFCFPIIEHLKGLRGTYGLILAPTREIALQTQKTLEQFATPLGINSICLIGGVNLKADEEALRSGPHIIVGTPGRICDHLERGNLWLEYIKVLVLDEADRMLDMGFARELNRITDELPKTRQTLLFSATIPPPIDKLARTLLHDPVRIRIGKPLSVNRNVTERALILSEAMKLRKLMEILKEEPGTVIVFSRSKDSTYRLWRESLDYQIHDANYLSSNKKQSDREKALEGFKSGEHRVLFATDVAGRGIHVENVGHVINYDLPREVEDYIHRIGRTGRQNAVGKATSFVTPADASRLRRIEKVIGHRIPTEDLMRRGGGGPGRNGSRGDGPPARGAEGRSRRGGRGRGGDGRGRRPSEARSHAGGRGDAPRSHDREEPRRSHGRGDSHRSRDREEPRRSHGRGDSHRSRDREEPRRTHGRGDSHRSRDREESRRSHGRGDSHRSRDREEPRRSHGRGDSHRSRDREEPRRSHGRGDSHRSHDRDEPRRSHGRGDAPRSRDREEPRRSRGRGDEPRSRDREEPRRSHERGDSFRGDSRRSDRRDDSRRSSGRDDSHRSRGREGSGRESSGRGEQRAQGRGGRSGRGRGRGRGGSSGRGILSAPRVRMERFDDLSDLDRDRHPRGGYDDHDDDSFRRVRGTVGPRGEARPPSRRGSRGGRGRGDRD